MRKKRISLDSIHHGTAHFLGILPGVLLLTGVSQAFGQETCGILAQQHPQAVIGKIDIDHRKVVEPSDGLPPWVPLDTVNKLHISTAEKVIRRELLFKEGERLNPDLIEETRRNLRALDYFRDEAMECRLMEDDTVEVIVHVKETWSLAPIFSVQGVGGRESVTAGLIEKNLLGWGKSLSATYRSGLQYQNVFIERSWQVSYSDPDIMGTRLQLSGTVQGLETGGYVAGTFQRPFFSLETPWAGGLSGSHYTRKRRLILNGTIAGEYCRTDDLGNFSLGLALTGGPPVVHRLGVVYQYQEKVIRNFTPLVPPLDPSLVPQGYTISGPGLSYRRLAVDYVREQRIAKFSRMEDLNMANDLTITASSSLLGLGASRDELVFSASDNQGYRFRKGHFILAQGSAQGRWDGHEARDTTVAVAGDYFLQDTPLDFGPLLQTFHVKASLGYGANLSSDNLFALGWDTGLRGYASGSFTGNRLFLLTVEDRIFPARYLFGLIAIGVVPFWDAGYVWGEGQPIGVRDLRYDLGIGLRIGVPAVSGENILHLDLGIPVGHGYSLGNYVFTVVTSTTF